jgi:hypothetical protein
MTEFVSDIIVAVSYVATVGIVGFLVWTIIDN